MSATYDASVQVSVFLKSFLQEYKAKMLEWDAARKAWEDRVRAIESQKKALIEKGDMMQVH